MPHSTGLPVDRIFLFVKKAPSFRTHFFRTTLLLAGLSFSLWTLLPGIVQIFAAGDAQYEWTFANSGDYSLSDAALIQVANSSARLKTRSYTPDGSTEFLLHLDEANGNPVDSSNHAQSVTATNVTYGSGIVEGAAVLNGSTSRLSVPDSPELSFVQSHTLEAWIQLDEEFTETSDQRQTIFDKGEYQVYLDQETGKLTYEIAPTGTTTNWTPRAGTDASMSWDPAGKMTVSALVNDGSNVYAALGSATGDAEVWAWNGTTWEIIGGQGLGGSWAAATYEDVYALEVNGTTLYAGIGNGTGEAEVWAWNKTTRVWNMIGGDATGTGGQSWQGTTFETVTALLLNNGYLYVGLGSGANDAEVWRCAVASCETDSGWTKIGGDSLFSGWTANYEQVLALEADSSNRIYAGLGLSAGDAEVWRYDSGTWSKLGGDGTGTGGQSWTTTGDVVTAFEIVGNNLYVGLGNTANANDGAVWQCDITSCTPTSGWTLIGGGGNGTTNWGAAYEQVWSLESDGTYLYSALGNTAGDNEVWRCPLTGCTSTGWTKIGGDGLNSSFTSTHLRVSDLTIVSGTLFAGVSGTATDAQVWTWNGTTWTRIAGLHVNNSWGYYGLAAVESMTTANGKLYAGLGNTVNTAMVWEYNGSTWTRIGGQGMNGGWTANTYENITSMTSFQGNLVVGLGTSANDAEVWIWHDQTHTWEKIGGDTLRGSWAANYESVYSLTEYNDKLYAGLGASAGDAEVWAYDSTLNTWTQVGGTATGNWGVSNYESVLAMTVVNNALHVGLGVSTTEAETWQYSGSGTAWTKTGGDGVNSSWNTRYETVESMTEYNGKLTVGLGNTNASGFAAGEVWQFNGTTWTQIGGDGMNSSWEDLSYERVPTLRVYNGNLYAGLGITAGDGELWKYDGSTWTKVGGDGMNNSWSAAIERVASLAVYQGKLYAGLGDSAAVDALIYSLGDNKILQADATTLNTDWHHIAASYDGNIMRMHIGDQEYSQEIGSYTLSNSTTPLLIGAGYGNSSAGMPPTNFAGKIDEIRLSSVARNVFYSTPYSSSVQTIRPAVSQLKSGVASYAGFVTNETAFTGSIRYRLSTDGGSTWQYWNGANWATSASIAAVNTVAEINDNIQQLAVTEDGILWQAALLGNGEEQVTLSSVTVQANSDLDAPSAPNALTALSASGGDALSSETWYPHASPYFSWSGSSDGDGSGITGYYVYFGTDITAVAETAGTFQETSNFTAEDLTSGETYYLKIRAKDAAQNLSPVWEPFVYKLDTTAPTNPSTITVSPTGYASTNTFTFSWPSSGVGIANDVGSQIAGYQYKTGATEGALSTWSSTITETLIEIPNAAYKTDGNVFFLRTVDHAGNVSSASLQANYYFAGEGASAPRFLQVNPPDSTTNSFAFSWQAPESFSGEANSLLYCYTVNTLPSPSNCNYTSAGATSLSASSFATQKGINTFYVVAKNPSSAGGAINYGAYASISFTADTAAPGIPQGLDIADVSIKDSSAWRLALSWIQPGEVGSGVEEYEILRSTDNVTFVSIATTTGFAYIDTGLTQVEYYYKVRACDNVNNCGATSTAVFLLPTGKFTDAPALTSGPQHSALTTKKATISWTTDRAADSRVAFGTKSNDYFKEEAASSLKVASHEINLTNLQPGTQYFYSVRWTDEDGNTGESEEKTFTTEPAPTVSSVAEQFISIDSAAITFTVKDATKVILQYGKSTAYGAAIELSTSTAESTYTQIIDELQDNTEYHYMLKLEDAEGFQYEFEDHVFTTLPRPKIANVRFQEVQGTAQPTVFVSWETNTEVSSIVAYAPAGNPSALREQVNSKLQIGRHRALITGLQNQTEYVFQVRGRDRAGNEAISDTQRITTATDTRPPVITEFKIEAVNVRTGGSGSEEVKSQLVVTWNTDEPGTSQVEFGEGTGTTYSQSTQEDGNLTYNHLVIVSGLSPSKVYHLRAMSKDSTTNLSRTVDTVTITPKATDNALNLVIGNLSEVFGFLGQLQ